MWFYITVTVGYTAGALVAWWPMRRVRVATMVVAALALGVEFGVALS